MNYFYTRWSFSRPTGLSGSLGPFHTTAETTQDMQSFLAGTHETVDELFFKRFETKEEMEAYWKAMQP